MTEQEAQMLLMQGSAIDAGEAENVAVATGAVTAPVDPNAAAMEWIIVPEMLAWAICTAFPEVAQNYTPESKMELARKIAPVAEKYGWNGPGDCPELGLAVGAVGFSMPAVLAYKSRKAQIEEARRKAQAERDGSGQ